MADWDRDKKLIFVALLMACAVIVSLGLRIGEEEKKTAKVNDHATEIMKELEEAKAELRQTKDFYYELFGTPFDIKRVRTTTLQVTSYNPVEEQCDKDPLIAATNKLVKPNLFALPQAYRLSRGIKLGQTIFVETLGAVEVGDHMSSKYGMTARGDIICFIPKWSKLWGSKTLKIYWLVES